MKKASVDKKTESSVKKTVKKATKQPKKVAKKTATKKSAKKVVAKKTTKKAISKKTAAKKVAAKKTVAKKVVKKTATTKKKTTKKVISKNQKQAEGIQESLSLVNRDSHWMHAWWDVSEERRQAAEKGEAPLVLRLYDVSKDRTVRAKKRKVREIPLPPGVDTWYLEREKVKGDYVAEIGTLDSSGAYLALAESKPVDDVPVLNVPEKASADAQKLFMASLGGALSLGHFLSSSELSPEEGLAEFLTRMTPASGSLLGWESSPVGEDSQKKSSKNKEFRLWVKTRLVLYGETEPDASLTIRGEKWPLDSQGRFQLEMDLPEGDFRLPVHAVNKDGDLSESVVPVVIRRTE